MATINVAFPHQSVAVVDPQGRMTREGLRFWLELWERLNPGITETVTIAKLTPSGANGSLTFVNGVLTAVTQPT